MRCCKHYSPAADDMANHDGLQINDAYQFDKLLPHPSCTNKKVIGNNLFGGCPYTRNQDKCNFYEPEEAHILKTVRVRRSGFSDIEIRLEIARVTFGIVEFYITHNIDDDRIIQHTINAHEHAEQSRDMANELFDYEVNNFSDEDITDVPIEEDVSNSYLLEVTDAVRTRA